MGECGVVVACSLHRILCQPLSLSLPPSLCICAHAHTLSCARVLCSVQSVRTSSTDTQDWNNRSSCSVQPSCRAQSNCRICRGHSARAKLCVCVCVCLACVCVFSVCVCVCVCKCRRHSVCARALSLSLSVHAQVNVYIHVYICIHIYCVFV